MRYSDDIIEEVRQKNDIVDVVSQYVKLTRKGSSYFGLCPFHNEKTPSFSVTPGKQMYYCFGCGAGGNVFNFIMEYENYTFGEALKHLADRAGVELPKIEYSREVREKVQERTELLEINKQAAQYFYYQLRTEKGEQGYQYLTGRGLTVRIERDGLCRRDICFPQVPPVIIDETHIVAQQLCNLFRFEPRIAMPVVKRCIDLLARIACSCRRRSIPHVAQPV